MEAKAAVPDTHLRGRYCWTTKAIGMNVSKSEISREFEEIRAELHDDPFSASNRLVEFARKYSTSDGLISQVILLKSIINDYLIEHPEKLGDELLRKAVKAGEKVYDNAVNAAPEQVKSYHDQNTELRTRFAPSIAYQENVVEVENVRFSYGQDPASFQIKDLNLTLKLGEITAVLGENGNGKSTLLKLVAGRLSPQSGTIRYRFPHSKMLTHKDYLHTKQHIGYIPQRLPAWDGVVRNNLHYMAAIKGLYGKENLDEVEYILERLSLRKYENYKWKELAGGFQMRFELANALVWHPPLLVLDEPLANLDLIAQSLFLNDLKEMANNMKYPFAVLISSQHLLMMDKVATNVLFLKDGKPIFNDRIAEIAAARTSNIFEIETENTIHEIRMSLKSTPIEKIQKTGHTVVLQTPLDIKLKQVMEALLEGKDLKVSTIRDISGSTKSLLYNLYDY
jgi:ABC-2 type transport system ATP-binding protein